MAIAPTTANLAQQASIQNQQAASAGASEALAAQSATAPASTAQASSGAASTTAGTPLAQSLTAAAQQSATGAATTTTTTTQSPAGTTTTQQTKPVEEFNAPLLKLPARANMMDVANAMHVAAKNSNDTTARALHEFANGLQEQRTAFLDQIISIIWGRQ